MILNTIPVLIYPRCLLKHLQYLYVLTVQDKVLTIIGIDK